jgi:hypothetical protein
VRAESECDVSDAHRGGTQAGLLNLNLDIDYFDNRVEVIIYPGAFRVA